MRGDSLQARATSTRLDGGKDLVSGGGDRDLVEAFARTFSPLVLNLAAGRAFRLGVEDVSFSREGTSPLSERTRRTRSAVIGRLSRFAGRGGNDTSPGGTSTIDCTAPEAMTPLPDPSAATSSAAEPALTDSTGAQARTRDPRRSLDVVSMTWSA